MNHEVDLTTVTTEELWDELKTRFRVVVLSYTRDGKMKDSYNDGMWYSGSPSENLGVLEWSRINMTEHLRVLMRDGEIERSSEPPDGA